MKTGHFLLYIYLPCFFLVFLFTLHVCTVQLYLKYTKKSKKHNIEQGTIYLTFYIISLMCIYTGKKEQNIIFSV